MHINMRHTFQKGILYNKEIESFYLHVAYVYERESDLKIFCCSPQRYAFPVSSLKKKKFQV
jgi:hypothetical protein